MTDSNALLAKIRELRTRISQAQGIAGQAQAAVSELLGSEAAPDAPLEQRLAVGARRQALLDAAIRQLADESNQDIRPTRLIGKVRQQLERGRELIAKLKTLAEEPLMCQGDPAAVDDADEALIHAFRDTSAMTESTLRLVQAFPDAPSAQMRLGEGLEGIITAIGDRISALSQAVGFRKSEVRRRTVLVDLFTTLAAGRAGDAEALVAVGDELLAEVHESAPLRFTSASPAKPAEFIACHGLTTARVVARLIRHDPEWQVCDIDAVVGALLKDVGMMTLDPAILATAGPLSDEHVQQLKTHCRIGSEMVAQYLPATASLCEAIVTHHERLDGSGYPAKLKDQQIGPLPRLLAVADVYAALCSPRPHRPALDPRTALTETMLLAERGLLDPRYAERLTNLSFYPVGSVVELADGSVGLVVASHMAPREMINPARPVVALLAEADGRLLPTPRHVDLAECDGRSIVRTLPGDQRRQLLGRRYPELV